MLILTIIIYLFKGIDLTKPALMEHFVLRVADMAHSKGLQFGGWEDGIMDNLDPYDRLFTFYSSKK